LLNAAERTIVTVMFFGHTDNFAFRFISESWLAMSTAVASILFFFSIYWLLPNRKLPARPVLRVSIVTGLLWVGAKYVFVAVLPRLDLKALVWSVLCFRRSVALGLCLRIIALCRGTVQRHAA
jgi:membrane protein